MNSSVKAQLVLFLFLSIVLYSFPDQAVARIWRPDPTSAALEYTQILDERSETEMVILWWFAPENLKRSPETETARIALRNYVMIAVAHVDVSPLGTFTFRTPRDVLIKTANGTMRQPLAEKDLPPVMIGMTSVLRKMVSQALGPFGQGIKWYIFDGKGIDSCKEGLFWVVYAGEQYDYKTPIPGCD